MIGLILPDECAYFLNETQITEVTVVANLIYSV